MAAVSFVLWEMTMEHSCYLCVASHNQEMIDVLHKTIEHDEVGWERAAILIV